MDKKLLLLAVLIVIAVGIFSLFTVFKIPLAVFTRASQGNSISIESSLIFAWPLEIKADGKDVSEITVFIRNSEGKGIPSQSVRLTTSDGNIKENLLSTSTQGKATFHISSLKPGIVQIEAFTGNKKLKKTVSVKFL